MCVHIPSLLDQLDQAIGTRSDGDLGGNREAPRGRTDKRRHETPSVESARSRPSSQNLLAAIAGGRNAKRVGVHQHLALRA
eukprot:CAMPEP_0195114776 /NCGR_PEP_ID=MMETSP0448-20130528/106983_1 /TAXON_ID=66468 /ORGANISM="Heterocapsa triquestra, Strain CCMP 448" /LENGTH=80 /DNA_ID=CAMNT_0040151831 /DNA_START=42 /DNA_END=281 /DNA_ORIENTATION=+